MNKREHDLRMCFDQEYREKHEFIQKWINEHVDPWHETIHDNFGLVLLASWFMSLFSKNPFTLLVPMLSYLLCCFYYQFQRRKNSRKIAEAVWRDFPEFRSK